MADREDDRRNDGDDDEEDDEIDDTGYKTVKDAVLFAIDVSSSMLEVAATSGSKGADKDSATSAALKCAYALMQQRIISNPSDMMGILLFGTKESKFQDDEDTRGGFQYPHCYLLADLDVPAAADVKRLRSTIEDPEESKKLLMPADEQVAMSNVLFCANQIFTTKAPNFSSRRLFLVTDNDNPHSSSRDLRSSAVVRAKDLYDLGVVIELFPISKPDHEFDRSKFYDDIVYRSYSSDPEAPAPTTAATKNISSGDGITLLQALLTSINSKAAQKRALSSNVPFEFSPSLRISVSAYVVFKRQLPARTCYVWLDGELPQIAIGKSTRLAEDTARTVEKVEIRKAYKFGGESITFTPEEISALRNFGDPVIRLLGFKPLTMIPIWAHYKQATFIYPSEDQYIGSTRTFSALQQTLLEKDKVGIVFYIARKNSSPVIAALIPGAEKLGEQGEQLMPAGMWLVPLPYADDIRSNPEMTSLIRAPDDLIDKMRQVVQQLQLPKAMYDPSKYPNPALQWHYKILQALALEEDLPEVPEDKTIPKYRQIDKRAGAYVVEWGVLLEELYRKWQIKHAGAHPDHKRAASSTISSTAKKAKTSGDAGAAASVTDEEMQKRFVSGDVGKYTVAILKEWISGKALGPVTGLKKDGLVEKIEGYFESKKHV